MQIDIRLNLTSQQVRLHLLEGFDSWLALGLLSNQQVLELATQLSEPLPIAPIAQTAVTEATTEVVTEAAFVLDLESAAPSAIREASWLVQALHSLLEEISVIWLLFLGVFLVVVSSGVLAASQWQSFSAVGQYAILLTYTLAFWGASLWTKRQEQFKTTARMLVLTTLLLVPVNFWMMDALGVLSTGLGKGVGGLAAIALSYLPLRLLTHRSNQLNLIGLSWLHWGWASSSLLGFVDDWGLWPVVATYLGTVGTTVNLIYQNKQLLQNEISQNEISQNEISQNEISQNEISSFDVLTVALTVLILLFRSLFVAQVPPHQLGLAVGICGWLLAWLNRSKANQAIWQWAGLGLLLLGWTVSVTYQPPWQAIAVSMLALWLTWDRLRQRWEEASLLALVLVAGQTYWLLGGLIPSGTRETILTQLANQLSAQPITTSAWTSLSFFPFLLGLWLFAWQLSRWQKLALAKTTGRLAVALGISLTLLSLTNSFTTAVNLLLSAVTLFFIGWRRSHISYAMVALTNGVSLLALGAWVNYLWPNLTGQHWTYVLIGGAIAQFGIHLLLRSDHWRRSTWQAGIALFALSYWPLYASWNGSWNGTSNWMGLVAPITLTVVASTQRSRAPQTLAKFTLVALLLQTPWLTDLPIAIISFAVGTLCMLIQSRQWQTQIAALFTVGSGIACLTCCLTYGLIDLPNAEPGRLIIFWAGEIGLLGLLAQRLERRLGNWMVLYRRAVTLWAQILTVGLLIVGSIAAGLLVQAKFNAIENLEIGLTSADLTYIRYILAATIVLIAVLLLSLRQRTAENNALGRRAWGLAWAVQIAVTIGLMLRSENFAGLTGFEEVAIATLTLGLLSQFIGDLRASQHPPYRSSWHGIPIAYAVLGLLFGHHFFVANSALANSVMANSGLYTLAAAVICIGVGRRKPSLQGLSYAGLIALSVGAYELLIYRLLQASGGQIGDDFTQLAALSLAIAIIERCTVTWLTRYCNISPTGLRSLAHAHWGLGSAGVGIAALAGLSQPNGIAIWTVISLILAGYALVAGNRRWTPSLSLQSSAQTSAQTSVQATSVQTPRLGGYTEWTTVGLLEALLCIAYIRFVWFFDASTLLTWGPLMACAIGLGLYRSPWERWGWPASPWKRLGLWLPILTLSIVLSYVQTQSLLVIAAFYAWMAKQFGQVRISYLSILLFDWALLRYLYGQGWLSGLWVSWVFGLSVLYVVEIDPHFQTISRRQQRHWLRTLSTGLIGLTSLYQVEIGEPMLVFAALTIFLSVISIFAGLIFKTRAFLYVGTITFIVQIIRVLWLAIDDYSSLLWAVGIVLGMLFIWVAATFESRRSQVISLIASWGTALQTWD